MNNKIIKIILIFFLYSQSILLRANDDTYINSSNITFYENGNKIELAENSKINIEGVNLLIDRGIVDYEEDKIEVFGNFYLYENLNILSGKNLKGNVSLNKITANDVSYIYNNDLKIDSNKLDRNNNLIIFHENFITPCELEGYFNCPTWSLRIEKTKYEIAEDKFTHYDSFLQIADYKIFYLPYFTHYGAKAPRKKGFLTPTSEFTIGGNQALITPYYLPLGVSTDLLIKPKIYIDENFEILTNYELNTILEKRTNGGNIKIEIDNIKKSNSSNINSSFKIFTKQVIDQNKVLSASGLFTNSVSTSRSTNDEPITFEDIFIRLENYNLFLINDYLKTEISSIESFKSSDNASTPISPSITYSNYVNLKNQTLINELDFSILRRDESSSGKPSESLKISLKNELINSSNNKNLNKFNKLLFINSISESYFNNENNTNSNSNKSFFVLSTDLFFIKNKNITPRVKLILPTQFSNTNKSVNEDSNAITFNYHNQYSENRFFGYDKFDVSSRIVYGLENEFNLGPQKISLNINQSYDFSKNTSYTTAINQNKKLSDYAIEVQTTYKDVIFKLDARLDQQNQSKKEMNYSFNFSNPINFEVRYHETDSDAFSNTSNDTQAIDLNISKRINKNLFANYSTNLDVKNNYDPYKSTFMISLSDECSQLDLAYTNIRFNDNFNTKPEEKISLSYRMDYLGFFGYEQSTNLFFSQPGEFNYGL
ncbi:MAG: LPS-assembly protein LptD [Alphaproteobacteria bacterium]